MITISKAPSGAFTVGNTSYPISGIRITWAPNAGKVTIMQGNLAILETIHYSLITNPDTSAAFVSFAALKTWLEANVLTEPGEAKSVTITSVTTAAVGTDYTAFASAACNRLSISNGTGTAIEFRRGGTGTAFPIPSGTIYNIDGITNANQISVRRVDTSNTQVTVPAEAKNI